MKFGFSEIKKQLNYEESEEEVKKFDNKRLSPIKNLKCKSLKSICVVAKVENRSIFEQKSNSVIEDKSMNTTINFDFMKTHHKFTANPDRLDIIRQGVFSTRNILLTTDELIADEPSIFSVTSRGKFKSISPTKKMRHKNTRTMKNCKEINDKLKKLQSNQLAINELYTVSI